MALVSENRPNMPVTTTQFQNLVFLEESCKVLCAEVTDHSTICNGRSPSNMLRVLPVKIIIKIILEVCTCTSQLLPFLMYFYFSYFFELTKRNKNICFHRNSLL